MSISHTSSLFQARFGGLSFCPGGFERTCYLFTPRRCRRIYIQDMAKKNEKIWKEAEAEAKAGPTYHMLEQADFEKFIQETLKAQEASLNAMKIVSKAIFGWSA